MAMQKSAVLILIGLCCVARAALIVDSFGAVANEDTDDSAFKNSAAFLAAFSAANKGSDRTVLVPAGKTYTLMPILLVGMQSVTFQLEGTILASLNISAWPLDSGNGYADLIKFQSSKGISIIGSGLINGRGYEWWLKTILNELKHDRPKLLSMFQCVDIYMDGIRAQDAPMFHFPWSDVRNVTVKNIDIWVNTTEQRSLLTQHGHWHLDLDIPLFPLNTDGFDPSGADMLFQNITVCNFDDVVAVKPMHNDGMYSTCSENILVENSRVRHGVGMTIGSVPPNPKVACVRNVTFRNVVFDEPYKAIYVKTNPGVNGNGTISDILYENFYISKSIWWAIYIGPQQQEQPDGTGPGCMFYPIEPICATQPRIAINNIILRNITVVDSLLPPGILRCNDTRPCENFIFDGVHVAGSLVDDGKNFICENVQLKTTDSHPVPQCVNTAQQGDEAEVNKWADLLHVNARRQHH
eukprot:TRINITY_DN12947_c0_g1_i1.p1 TRINITY_DN12947_c0_g1~~TRINITY_DN12947_c0_g1_i1.p1  ORF type:complete len:467 (-),score=99.21 TRINITY_DN12947_c0_g1_i1:98-1498(-)